MPTYRVTDPRSGKTLSVSGDSPPTEGELYKLFAVEGGPETRAGGIAQSLSDTALGAAKGVAEGFAAPVLHPIETVKGLARTVAHPLDAASGLASFATRAATEGLAPEEGGQAIGAILGAKYLPGAGTRVVKGLKRLAPAVSSGTELALAGAKGAATNLPFVSGPVKGAIRGVRGALKERALAADAARPAMAEGFDQFMPNRSATPSAEPTASVTPHTPAGPTGSGVRSFLESEQQGQNALGKYWDDMGFVDDVPPRAAHPGQGLENYAGTAADPSAVPPPARMPLLTSAERDLVDKLFAQQQASPMRPPRPAITDPRRMLEDAPHATGIELGQLLERLARGR